MRQQSTHDIGTRCGEEAAAHLSTAGIEILARSSYCRGGEIDLIGSDGRCLILFEVRCRSSKRDGLPFSAIGNAKRRRLLLTAR